MFSSLERELQHRNTHLTITFTYLSLSGSPQDIVASWRQLADAPEAALQLFWRNIDLEKTGVNVEQRLLPLVSILLPVMDSGCCTSRQVKYKFQL